MGLEEPLLNASLEEAEVLVEELNTLEVQCRLVPGKSGGGGILEHSDCDVVLSHHRNRLFWGPYIKLDK